VRVLSADVLQGPTLNNMMCEILNWQLANHTDPPCSSAKLAHPLTLRLPPEPASRKKQTAGTEMAVRAELMINSSLGGMYLELHKCTSMK
jgi:hypothetical protein